VASVRVSTKSAPVPYTVPGPSGVSCSKFDPIDCPEVTKAIWMLVCYQTRVPNPVPTSLANQLADDVSPFLIALVSRSLSEVVVSAALKTLHVPVRQS